MPFLACLFALILLIPTGLHAADALPKPGTMAHGIVSTINPGEKFTIFLPAAYTEKKKWPVLVLFSLEAAAKTHNTLCQGGE